MRTAGASRSRNRILARLLALVGLVIAFAPLRVVYAQSDPVTAADAERLGVLDAVDDSSPVAPPSPAAAPVPAAPALSAAPVPPAGTTASAPPGGRDLIAPSSAPDSGATEPIVEASPSITPPSKPVEPAHPLKSASVAADALPPSRPVITTPSVPEIPPGNLDTDFSESQGMQEIPQAVGSPATETGPAGSNDADVERYRQQGVGDALSASGIGSLRDFVSEGEESSPIGVQLREARRKLKGGEEADGLLVMKVVRDSPAAKAGLKPYRRIAQNMLTGATIAAAMVFPPAILILPVLDYTQVGESYDMIIGVDGARVTNFIDFEERMRDVEPGQLVYLSVVRNGKRLQLEVPLPPNAQVPSY